MTAPPRRPANIKPVCGVRQLPQGQATPTRRALEDSTGSMELRARMTAPPRRKVRLARDRMMPGSTTRQRTSGPILLSISRLTMPPSTTTRSPGCQQNLCFDFKNAPLDTGRRQYTPTMIPIWHFISSSVHAQSQECLAAPSGHPHVRHHDACLKTGPISLTCGWLPSRDPKDSQSRLPHAQTVGKAEGFATYVYLPGQAASTLQCRAAGSLLNFYSCCRSRLRKLLPMAPASCARTSTSSTKAS